MSVILAYINKLVLAWLDSQLNAYRSTSDTVNYALCAKNLPFVVNAILSYN